MKRKLLSVITGALMFACCLFFITGCGEVHKAETKWSADETTHWHACVVDGCKEKYDEEQHTFQNDICTVCYYGAEARIGATGYKTFAEALSAAEENNTVTLVKNLTNESGKEISIDKNITIDFGGHTLTSTKNGFDIAYKTAGAQLTLKNGTLQTAEWGCWLQNAAKLVVENDFEIIANTSKTKAKYGIVVTQGAQLDLYGKVTAKSNSAVSGLGDAGFGDVTINIFVDSVLTSLDSAAIYMPNTYTLNIYGGTITGETAIYAKSGKITINGGTFIATGAKKDYVYNGGGFNETGDAFVIDACCQYPGGDPEVTISGGTFVSANANAIAYYKREGISNTAKITNNKGVKITEITVPATAFAG